jgi:hypothetical protein
MGYLPTWWESCCSLWWRGIRYHRVGEPKSCFNPWIPRLSPQITMELPFLPSSLLCWVVGWKGWWMGNCRVSHGSYHFTADRNRCHRVLLNLWTSVHKFIFVLPFSFLFLSLPLCSFLHNPLSQIWILRDFDEMWEIHSLQSLEIRMSSYLWTWENLVIYG